MPYTGFRPFVVSLVICLNVTLLWCNLVFFVYNSTTEAVLSSWSPVLVPPILGRISQSVSPEYNPSVFGSSILIRGNAGQLHEDSEHPDAVEYEDEEDQLFYDEKSLVEEVEHARLAQRFGKYIGAVSNLRPGLVLLADHPHLPPSHASPSKKRQADRSSFGQEKEVSNKIEDTSEDGSIDILSLHHPFQADVILLTAHGGDKPSVGFVMNSKLPEAESKQAREMLRENTDANMFDGSERRDLVRAAIRDRGHLWLGAGGPLRNAAHLWTHIHNCSHVNGAQKLAKGVYWKGDILELLIDDTCFIKLLYGSAAWSPGQLDLEIINGLWTLRKAVDKTVLEPSADSKLSLLQATMQPEVPTRLKASPP